MSELSDLYQDVILDHNRSPRNFRVLADANHRADGFNPLCGDKVTVFLKLDGDRIADVSFQGSGCAISTASASLATAALKGKTIAEADALFALFHDMVTSDPTAEAHVDGLGKLAAFAGVREFPTRIKCATLVWHTLKSAMKDESEVVTTE
ncbi:MAG: SUF system NifU family Fe-S cluster assembly protein [Deltaproteobacteria bacterium]|nr:SUF system NifU family Fe-S cluster assembly protein [Deltaproteobacteria bacterium]